ncbi:hypothetical protein phytr_11800 [Candidatus Phycorickettsia trachydisci]|uniref:Uncharacterized protein n=1 Tax=Candidatus Phycorickettsia trachydisci TaxID=2115978 RepID=A0A2P1PA32_9RICK|nr:hypothetical protein [Candidatus Phycorickettsia trachydisci]AVP88105.1 hypothetical protein phytr_11800 [Candidatus Phycorickettsia trachydisci]
MDNVDNKSLAKTNKTVFDFSEINEILEDGFIVPQSLMRQSNSYSSTKFEGSNSFVSTEFLSNTDTEPGILFPSTYTHCTSFEEALDAANQLEIDIVELLEQHTECEFIEIINHHLQDTRSTPCYEPKLQELFAVANDLGINTDIILENANMLGIFLHEALESAIFESQNYMHQNVSPKNSSESFLESKKSALPNNKTRYRKDLIDDIPNSSINPSHQLRKNALIKELSLQGIDKLTAQAIAEAKFENKKFTPKSKVDEIEDIKSPEHIILEENLDCSGSDLGTSDTMD